MGDEVSLKDVPEGFKNRFDEVQLSDGSKIKVWKWSNQKYPSMIRKLADLDEVEEMAVQSVAPEERERVKGLDWPDLLTIKLASVNLNLPEAALKNLGAHLDQTKRATDAINGRPSPSKVS